LCRWQQGCRHNSAPTELQIHFVQRLLGGPPVILGAIDGQLLPGACRWLQLFCAQAYQPNRHRPIAEAGEL
jgi:hypothetical protein